MEVFRKEPHSLQTLALEAIIEHWLEVFTRSTEEEKYNVSHNIGSILCQPPFHIFADQAAKLAFNALWTFYSYDDGIKQSILHKELVLALISDKVTNLEIDTQFLAEMVRESDTDAVARDVWRKIGKLQFLKRLYIGGRIEDVVHAQFPGQLEALKLAQCTDRTIAILAHCCPRLKILNINRTTVTNESSLAITKLKHLEELDIRYTRIRCLSFPLFSTALSENLKKFCCSYIDVGDINLMAKSGRFRKLVHLCISKFLCNDVLEKGFDSLCELSLASTNYNPDFLQNSGQQLKIVILTDVAEVDMVVLAKQCPNLEQLKLISVTAKEQCHRNPAPSFHSLKHLELSSSHFCYWCILTKCGVLKRLSIQMYCNTRIEDEDEFYERNRRCLKQLLANSQLSTLRELDILYDDAAYFMWILLKVCSKNLRMLRLEGLRSLVHSVKRRYPKLEIVSL